MNPQDAARQVTVEGFHLGGGPTPAVLATFDVRLGRALVIRGVRLREGRNGGQWVAWPGRKDLDTGEWFDVIVVPDWISTAVRDQAQAAYEAAAASPPAVPPQDDLDGLPF
jgi:DNA-binding cell septation regulator SpoVG